MAKNVVASETGDELLKEAVAIKAALEAAKADPDARKIYAKHTVDAMQQDGFAFTKVGDNLPKHGIPTTREEFDKAYADASVIFGENVFKRSVGMDAKVASNKALQDASVDVTAAIIKNAVPDIVNELKNRGIDPSGYLRAISNNVLAPADIDTSKLDPRLTDDERKMVVATQAVSKTLTDGRLQSKPEDAPTTSKWANRIRAEQAAALGKPNGVA